MLRWPLRISPPIGVRFRGAAILVIGLLLQLVPATPAFSQFPETMDLWQDGQDLLVVGRQKSQKIGRELAGGDINGDGLHDLVIGVEGSSPLGRQGVGEVVIVWGGINLVDRIDLSSKSNPVSRVFGESGRAGLMMSLSTGDFNGDGCCDIILGLPYEPPYFINDGIAYVIWGRQEFPDTLDLETRPPGVTRLSPRTNSGGHLGYCSTAGDLNGDGYDDVIVSAKDYDNVSHVFILLGREQWPNSIYLSGSDSGLKRIIDQYSQESTGSGLACGDLNGDGMDDLVVGASGDVQQYFDGKATVIFGRTTWPDTIMIAETLHDAMRVLPPPTPPQVVTHIGEKGTMAVADVDADGFDDLLLASRGMSTELYTHCGGAWLLFGGAVLPDTVRLLRPSVRHLVMHYEGDWRDCGRVVTTGDVDADGLADIVITNDNAEVSYEDYSEVIVVYGSSVTGVDTLNLARDTLVTTIVGEDESSEFGRALATVDLSADGVDDLVIGAHRSARNGVKSGGAVYVLNGIAAEIKEKDRAAPPRFTVQSAFPTPSPGGVTLGIGTPVAGEFRIDVYDVLGRRITGHSLLLESGWTEWEWDGRSADGVRLPSGVYFARVQDHSGAITRRMVLVR